MFPPSPEFPLSSSTCNVLGNVGTVPVRLLEPSSSCVSPLKDDRALGMVLVSEVDVRSSVCREAARDDDAASVASGDGDSAWELTNLHSYTSKGHSAVKVRLTNSEVP